jgi:dihydrofolate synthase / folylpolyglutamate synthase
MTGGQAPGRVRSCQWLESLSPWPTEGFGLERMLELLERLSHPERAFPAIHVVGTNGKTTATRTIAALLRGEGLNVGAYTSPHVRGWAERLDTDEETFERAIARVRPHAEAVGATQFEALTAAALAQLAVDRVEVAVVEAGLGGRLDATNVLDASVVHLTNVGLDHTDILGATLKEVAREKLAVARPGAIVVLGEPEWAALVPHNDVVIGGPRETAEAFLGRPVTIEVEVSVPGRLEWRGERELWDGAHNPEGVDWLLARLPDRDWVVVASVLRDKNVEGILTKLARAAGMLVATSSTSPRALRAPELARRAVPLFRAVETVADPVSAVVRARELAGAGGSVLVTGSLYLLADLSSADPVLSSR